MFWMANPIMNGKMFWMANPIMNGKMFWMANPIMNGKMFRMANPERVIYRVGSLTLPFCPVSACHVSKERVTQHKALWPEVPLDTIDASLQPAAFKHAPPNMRIINMLAVHMRVIFVEGCNPPRK